MRKGRRRTLNIYSLEIPTKVIETAILCEIESALKVRTHIGLRFD